MSCQLFTPDGHGGCCWCRTPRDGHRFVPCGRCAGFPYLPDPTDRTARRVEAKRRVLCACRTGWLVRETGKVADVTDLETVGWRRPGARERSAA